MNRFNRADCLLAAVACLFVLLLIAKVKYGYHFWLEGAFFCTEAALVGGIADWFAVTALFKKPLGFPYHTALIPRKRAQLVENCIHLVQREFFSRKSLIARLKKEDLLSRLLAWLETENGHALLSQISSGLFSTMAAQLDTDAKAAELSEKFRQKAAAYPLPELTERLVVWLVRNGYDVSMLDRTLDEVEVLLAREATRLKIMDAIRDYIDQQSKNPLFALMFMFAKSTDVLNFEEAADVIQSELVRAVADLRKADNPMRACLLEELNRALAEIKENETVQSCLAELRDDMLDSIDLYQPIKLFLDRLLEVYGAASADGTLSAAMNRLIDAALSQLLASLKENAAVRQQAEAYIYDLTGRAILQAQALLGTIVKSAMKILSDEELNELIYGRVETDLLWIRMNGSIVGALIGAVLFMLLNLGK